MVTYFEQIEEDGLVALHISNRHLDLEPVVGRIATDLGLAARIQHFQPGLEDTQAAPTVLVVLAHQAADLGSIDDDSRWSPLRIGDRLWTDTYTDLISVIQWG
jgi:hypothetical protein